MSKLQNTIVYLTEGHSKREATGKLHILGDIQGQLSLNQSAKVVTDCAPGNERATHLLY
ncbi:hypothetical protein R3W88_016322 [Solanum pinnatisectum]|uniref:Uncharacterized protein n=1 Tax=Solanum pinnatisectum TaxID=50273 RepID=A0AAV9KX92_9SOLN|nr:hypothetical protein R3W88_016322 [Solanum pinnatisectum]